MKVCEKCNNKFIRDIDTCPLCGGNLIDIPEAEAPAPAAEAAQAEAPAEAAAVEEAAAEATEAAAPAEAPAEEIPAEPAAAPAAPEAAKKKGSKKVWIIIAALVAALAIGGAWYKNYTAPRTLIINGDESINVNVGESAGLSVSAEGFDGDALSSVAWSIANPDIVAIEDGTVTGAYDMDSFAGGDGKDVCSTTIHGTLKDGLRTWEGNGTVYVHLVPQDFSNGQIFKEPAGSKDSFIEISVNGGKNTYLYFRSTTDPANDCAFIIAAVNSATIDMPLDTYEVYLAQGDTWYGTDIKFGPNTGYQKLDGTMQFEAGKYWTLGIGVVDGNTGADDIGSEDFPEA